MKKKLTVIDRLTLVNGFFKDRNDLLSMALILELEQKVKVSSKELAKVDFDQKTETLNLEKNDKFLKEIDFTTTEIDFIKDRIEVLDKSKEINRQILNLHKTLK